MVTDKPPFFVELWYSSDYIPRDKEFEKIAALRNGGDLVTKVLNYFHITYTITLASDFYHAEPVLEKVQQFDKHGRSYTVYSRWHSFYYIDGQDRVLRQFEELGVIPCTDDEAIKKAKKEEVKQKNGRKKQRP